MKDQLRSTGAPFGDAADVAELSDEYELLGELGRGGTAVVYRAQDRTLGREVAIKVVHPRAAAPGDDPVARLAREARTVAQLQHPNIVTVFAVRRLRSGGLALVMQLVPGATLKQVVQREGPLAPDRAERVLRDVAQALAYAHARGIVHRDVKPENIFLDEESGRAMLSDFGIARSDEHDSMTMTGTALGTPFYMSPEQVEGKAVDGRSDLYSLGLVAWEMLTGRRPWDGESLYNVIYKQKHEELPPIEALRAGVPQRLQYVVERMLQKRPASRWAGADGLLAQLSHTVLPSDFGKWQVRLRTRVERWREQEREREKAVADSRPRTPAGGSATVRFPRRPRVTPAGGTNALDAGTMRFERAPGDAATRAIDLQAGDSLAIAQLDDAVTAAAVGETRADTDGIYVSQPIAAPDPTQAPVVAARYDDVAAPDWADAHDADASPRRRRARLTVGGVLAALAVAATAYGARDRLVGIAPAGLLASGPQDAPGATLASDPRAVAPDPSVTDSASVPGTAAPGTAFPIGASGDVLAVGGRHGCVVTFGAAIYCWGANDRGQLGDAGTATRTTPVRVAGDIAFAQVTAGAAHSCGLTADGVAYCWGEDAVGQLGDATRVRRTAPVRVVTNDRFAVLRAGGTHSCGITTAGDLACWGANDRGQLGDDSPVAARTTPTRVRWPAEGRAASLAVGTAHACALSSDGRAFCWGANESGQLGDGTRADRRAPVAVGGEARFTALAAGRAHTCGATTDGRVLCWGSNAERQVGVPDRRAAIPTPTVAALPLNARAIAVTAGAAHSCALGAAGDAWCWGRNAGGQLGTGTRAARVRPVAVRAPAPLAAIGAAAVHTCALTTAGAPICWGVNAEGQVGDSTRTGRAAPTPVKLAPQLVSRPLIRSR
jgi:alpha-tubulin suppressor-like RCC1 family protein